MKITDLKKGSLYFYSGFVGYATFRHGDIAMYIGYKGKRFGERTTKHYFLVKKEKKMLYTEDVKYLFKDRMLKGL